MANLLTNISSKIIKTILKQDTFTCDATLCKIKKKKKFKYKLDLMTIRPKNESSAVINNIKCLISDYQNIRPKTIMCCYKPTGYIII